MKFDGSQSFLGRARCATRLASCIASGWSTLRGRWRHVILGLCIGGPLVLLFLRPPIPQPKEYFQFVDRRAFLGVPNFFDVITNLAFLLVGIGGLTLCLKRGREEEQPAWKMFFLGLILVGVGSSYFHWNPCNETLLWDRLPMTIGFCALFVAILGEYVDSRIAPHLLLPALLVGAISVFWWHWFGDLRLYLWIQFMPLLAIPVVMLLFRGGHSHQGYLVISMVSYVFAKVAEILDRQIFEATLHTLSGHSLKHLLASLGCAALVLMLKRRGPTTASLLIPQPSILEAITPRSPSPVSKRH